MTEDREHDDNLSRPPESLPAYTPGPDSRVAPSADVKIVEIDLKDKAARARFMDMADSLYTEDPNYIAPLRMTMDKNLNPNAHPVFKHMSLKAMIAVQDGKDLARMTVHIDHDYNEILDKKTGFFGFFESVDDKAVAHTILQAGVDWLKEHGVQEVFGPGQYHMSHQAGLLVENFDRPPFVEQPYNHPYYEALLTSFGFGKAKDMYVWMIDIAGGMERGDRKRFQKIADRIVKRENIEFRSADLSRATEEIKLIYRIYTDAWKDNWGSAPVTEEEFVWMMEDFKSIAIPELVVFTLVDGKEVGFSATVPNVNETMPKDGKLFPFGWLKALRAYPGPLRHKYEHGRLWVLGVLPEFRKRGLEAVLIAETVRRGAQVGLKGGEVGWTLEDNHMINSAIEKMGCTLDRRYRILGMSL